MSNSTKIVRNFENLNLFFPNLLWCVAYAVTGGKGGALAKTSGPDLMNPNHQIGDTDTIWSLVIGSQGKFGDLCHRSGNRGTARQGKLVVARSPFGQEHTPSDAATSLVLPCRAVASPHWVCMEAAVASPQLLQEQLG